MAEQKNELVDMLIRFYNYENNSTYRVGNPKTRFVVSLALEKANNDIDSIKKHIRNHKGEWIYDVFESYEGISSNEQPQTQTNAQPQSQVNGYMGLLEKAVVDLIAKTNADEIESKIFSNLEERVNDFIKQEYGTIERKIITVVDEKKTEMQGIQHDKFETVLKFVSNNEPVFLTGPAGSGKNVLCQQVAKALGLDFYFTNAVTQEYKITGFTDAMGVFHESQFFKAFKNGGLFMLDEMDASIPEVLIILNSAIANKYFDFPAPIGYVEAHPNFRVISAGNTFGQGADMQYVGRNQLDMASLDRFAMVNIDYSHAIEMNVSGGNVDLVNFAEDFRKSASKAGIMVVVSYRAIGRIAKMEKLLPLKETLKTCLVKGMEKDDLNMILNEMKVKNTYTQALEQLVREM